MLAMLSGRSACGRRPVDPSTLDNKVLFGYQGWFTCPADGSQRWTHWSRGVPAAETLTVELYPDLSELDADERCEVPGMTIGGKPAYLFSSRNQKTVSRHFRWMKEYGLDGVLVQRFVGEIRRKRADGDVVLKNIMAAAKESGRTFAIEYDISGGNRRDVRADVEGRLGVPGRRTEGNCASELSAPQRKAGAVRLGHGLERRQRPSAGRCPGRAGPDRVVQVQGPGTIPRHLHGRYARAMGNPDAGLAQATRPGQRCMRRWMSSSRGTWAATELSKLWTAGRKTCSRRM